MSWGGRSAPAANARSTAALSSLGHPARRQGSVTGSKQLGPQCLQVVPLQQGGYLQVLSLAEDLAMGAHQTADRRRREHLFLLYLANPADRPLAQTTPPGATNSTIPASPVW